MDPRRRTASSASGLNHMETEAEAATKVSSTGTSPPRQQRRKVCGGCGRPIPVCLCHFIPSTPIRTTTQIVILHHPHEVHHKLNTTPLLTKCLLNAISLPGRRLRPNLHPLLDQFPPAIYLFPPSPSSPAIPLSQLKTSLPLNYQNAPLVLIVFDGTWKHAKEMVSASEGFMGKFAIRVCLDNVDEGAEGGSIYDSELLLRKEPYSGCVSTMEAVARCLGVIEENGKEIERSLIGVLREMVRLQARFLKPMKPRPKIVKKGKEQNKEESENFE